MSYKPVDTAIVMVVGPCIDGGDFKTLEETISYNAAGMDISLVVEKTDGTTTVTAITLTTGGTSDWTHKDGGYYEVEVTAAQNAEEGIAYVRGVCTGVLPFESAHYNVVKANVYDSWVKGTDSLQVDTTSISGDSSAADNLEVAFDGTGYGFTGCTMPTVTTLTNKSEFSLSGVGVDAILDENIEGTHTLREVLRLLGAYAFGKSSGGGTTTVTFRDIDDTKNRIVATVTDVGNRTAITLTET